MATTSLTLTASGQSISGSDLGCSISYKGGLTATVDDDVFFYAFGSTEPTVWNSYNKPNDILNYDGSYGLMWVKQAYMPITLTINKA